MKMLIVISCLLILRGTVSADLPPMQEDTSSRIIESQIIAAIEEFRGIMKTGSEDFPILDPLLLEEFDFELEEIGAQGTINASGVIIENLSEFILKNIDFSLLARRLTMDIGVDELIIYADNMIIDGAADGQEIKGTGNGTLFLLDSGLTGTMRVRIPLFGAIQVYNVNIIVYLESMKSYLTFDEDTDGDLNEILEYLVPSYVQTHQKELSDFVSPLVEEMVNDFLRS